jgi:hypothetical protein
MELLILIENLIIIAMACCEVRTGVQLSAVRLPSVDLSSREDFRLLAVGTATRVTAVSEKLR